MAGLPLGVALVAVSLPVRVLYFVSDRLSSAELRAAKTVALYLLDQGARAAVISERELNRIMDRIA